MPKESNPSSDPANPRSTSCSTSDLSFAAQDRIVERVKKLIRNDVKVNRMWSHLRIMIENNQESGEAAMMILSLLASDPVEAKRLIDAIREPRDRSYERSY